MNKVKIINDRNKLVFRDPEYRTDATGGILFDRPSEYELTGNQTLTIASTGHVSGQTVSATIYHDGSGTLVLDLGSSTIELLGDYLSKSGQVYTFDNSSDNTIILVWRDDKIIIASARQSAVAAPVYSNSALSFNNTDEHFDVATITDFDVPAGSAYSWSFWAKPSSLGTTDVILQKIEIGGAQKGWRIRGISGALQLDHRAGSSLRMTANTDAVVLETLNYHHYVITVNNNVPTFYVDAVVSAHTVNTDTLDAQDTSTSEPLRFAADHNLSNYYGGLLDDVSLFQLELSQAQVTAIYNAGKPKDPSTFGVTHVDHWDMSSIPPLGKNGNDGVAVGMDGTNVVTVVP